MKRIFGLFFLMALTSMLVACGDSVNEDYSIKEDLAKDKTQEMISQDYINEVKEVVSFYRYKKEDNTEVGVIEVRLGRGDMTQSWTSYYKVWRSNSKDRPHINEISKEDSEELKQKYNIK